MKLSDIAIHVLETWPDEIKYLTQDRKGAILGHPRKPSLSMRGNWFCEGPFFILTTHADKLAEDWQTAVLEKQDWLLAKYLAAKANAELMYQAVQEAQIKLPSDPE